MKTIGVLVGLYGVGFYAYYLYPMSIDFLSRGEAFEYRQFVKRACTLLSANTDTTERRGENDAQATNFEAFTPPTTLIRRNTFPTQSAPSVLEEDYSSALVTFSRALLSYPSCAQRSVCPEPIDQYFIPS